MANPLVGFLLPHTSNNHRAKALHPEALLVYVFLFVLLNVSTKIGHAMYPSVLGYATDIRTEELFTLTNKEREKNGLSDLQLNAQLSEAAAQKANDMFANNYWAHNSPQGKVPWDFIKASGYKYAVAGENLAKNFTDSNGVVQAWMNSPSHRENILKSTYKDIGFAIVNGKLNGEETTLVVQMFGSTNTIVDSAPEAIVTQMPAKAAVPSLAVEKNVIVQTEALQTTVPESNKAAVLPEFTQVFSAHPYIDIPSLTRFIVYGFVGFLLGILALDGYIVMRRKIVRVTGHTIAHVVFFLALLLTTTAILPGSVL